MIGLLLGCIPIGLCLEMEGWPDWARGLCLAVGLALYWLGMWAETRGPDVHQ